MSTPIIGIDLGTSTSEIACLRNGHPELLQDEKGDRIIPSVVQLLEDGREEVGSVARRGAITYRDRTALEVKRLMGTAETVTLGEHTFRPEEVSAMILRYLKRTAEARFGPGTVRDVVISVPARFESPEREATRRAAELAGLNVLHLVNEPTAAAVSYGLNRLEDEQRILVFDFGGGTLDVTVLEMLEGVLDIKTSVGDDRLGGKDVDSLLMTYFAQKYKEQTGRDLPPAAPDFPESFHKENGSAPPIADLRLHAYLKEEAERYKKELSFVPSVEIDLRLDGWTSTVTLTRAEFERMLEPLVNRAMELVDQALQRAGVDFSRIEVILPVGGSSRIPAFRQELERRWGQPLQDYDNPDEAVARGAAIVAGIEQQVYEGTDKDILILDISSYRLGTDVVQQITEGQYVTEFFSELIPKDAKLPAIGRNIYTTMVDGQTTVRIAVYQASTDTNLCGDHRLVGEAFLENIPPAPAGYPIEVEFHYTKDGRVEVAARCLYAPEVQIRQSFVVEGGLDDAEFSAARLRLEDLWQSSDDVKRCLPLLNKAEEMIREKPELTEQIKPIADALRSALTTDDKAEIETQFDALTDRLFELS